MSAILFGSKIVHYEVLGRGRPVIFLHSWLGSWRYWIPAMQVASKSFRAYALDLWGFGDTAHDPEQYGLDDQIALLERFLLEMGIGKVALVGHGLGALIALKFSRHFPNLVDRVMAVDCPLDVHAVDYRMHNTAPADLAEWLLGKNPLIAPVRMDVRKVDQRAITRSLQGLDVMDFNVILNQMPVSCLFVHGQNDPAIASPHAGRRMLLSSLIHLVVLEQSGHFPMLEETRKFNRLLIDFLTLESGTSPVEIQLKEEWHRRVR